MLAHHISYNLAQNGEVMLFSDGSKCCLGRTVAGMQVVLLIVKLMGAC